MCLINLNNNAVWWQSFQTNHMIYGNPFINVFWTPVFELRLICFIKFIWTQLGLLYAYKTYLLKTRVVLSWYTFHVVKRKWITNIIKLIVLCFLQCRHLSDNLKVNLLKVYYYMISYGLILLSLSLKFMVQYKKKCRKMRQVIRYFGYFDFCLI